MIASEIKKRVRRVKAKLQSSATTKTSKIDRRKSKELKYDVEVPGDHGDCESESLSQGSE
jgi:hypothetical protein